MKKLIYFVVLIAIVSIGYLLFFMNQYHIDDKRSAIQAALVEWGSVDAEVIDVVPLDNTSSYIVLFQTRNGNVGYAHLIKGWNGKFKIRSSGHGSNIVSYREIQTNKGMYGILVGKNPELQINRIIADLYYEDFSFTANVSTEEMFVKYEQLPDDIEKTFPAELTLFDKNNEVIEFYDLLD